MGIKMSIGQHDDAPMLRQDRQDAIGGFGGASVEPGPKIYGLSASRSVEACAGRNDAKG
jgi:hypothetical protein